MPEKPIEQVLKEKKISEIVNPKLVQASPDLPISAAVEKMRENKSGYIVIARDQKVVGLFTEADLVQKILDRDVKWKLPVKDFMAEDPPVLTMNDSVWTAINLMSKLYVYYIPLVDEKKELVNVISVRTLIRFLAEFYPKEVYNLPPRIDQIMEHPEGG